MDLTIIIVNWNGGQTLIDCLASIRKYATPGVHVIVVDNDSSDGSRQRAAAEFPEFQVLNSGDNLGFGRGNNFARPYVKTRYVLFLNPDTEIFEGALEKMQRFLETHPEVGALGSQLLYSDGGIQELGLQWKPSPWTELLGMLLISSGTQRLLRRWISHPDPKRSGYVTKLYGGCIMASKELLDRIGWFDDRYFMYAEDVDQCIAIMDAGYKLYYLSEARVMHHCGGSSSKAGRSFHVLMKCASIAKFMRKHHGVMGQVLYRVFTFAGACCRLALLAVLKVLDTIMGGRRRDSLDISLFKYWMIFLWSLGLREATIVRRRASAPAVPAETAA